MPTDAESSYRALINKDDFSQQPVNTLQRANRTKSLLSGGFGRSAAAPPYPPQQPPPSMFPVQQPLMAPLPSQQQQHQQPGLLYGGGGPPRPPTYFAPPAPANFGGFGTAGYGSGAGYGGGAPGSYPFAWQPYRRPPSPSRKSRSRHRHRRSSHKKKWYERSRSRSRSRSQTRAPTGWWNTAAATGPRSPSRSRSRSSSRSSQTSQSSQGSCSTCTGPRHDRGRRRRDKDLSTLQRKIILGTIREYMPEKNLHDAVYQDIISQMEHMEKHGYRLPKEYDKHKHDISDNEIRLYEQQMQRDKNRDVKKVSNMISFSATCLSQFCEFMQVDWIKTKHLPRVIREALKEGEFEECMEGIGSYMRGSVFDHPIFSTVLKFVEKVGEAHNNETEEEQDKLEEEEERRERRHADSLRQLNKLRQDPAAPIAGVPAPGAARRATTHGSRSSAASASSVRTDTTAPTTASEDVPSERSSTVYDSPRQQKKMK